MKKFFKQSDFSNEILHSGKYVTPGLIYYFDVIVSGENKAVYNGIKGDIIPQSVLQRGNPHTIDNRYIKSINLENTCPVMMYDTALYLPVPFEGADHFGHLITEIIGLLYAFDKFIDTPIDIPLLIGEKEWIRMSKIHNFLNCNFNVEIIPIQSAYVTVKKIIMPIPTIHNRQSISPFHTEALQSLLPKVLNLDFYNLLVEGEHDSMPEKIYLSRSNMPSSKRKIINEGKLERELEKHGWLIIHPQELTLRQQLQYLYHASEIAGTVGSAFHLLMYFSSDLIRQKKIKCITHARIHLLNYILQFHMQNAEPEYAIVLEADKNCTKAPVNSDLLFSEESFADLKDWIVNNK